MKKLVKSLTSGSLIGQLVRGTSGVVLKIFNLSNLGTKI